MNIFINTKKARIAAIAAVSAGIALSMAVPAHAATCKTWLDIVNTTPYKIKILEYWTRKEGTDRWLAHARGGPWIQPGQKHSDRMKVYRKNKVKFDWRVQYSIEGGPWAGPTFAYSNKASCRDDHHVANATRY